ncbi:transmembrane protein 272-like [Hoplias malabaricus]|uniref:transmembrane protein 272-like n=1 Tax=Hoplias malabaricus TaxID=27720 RepID=UPI003462ADE3
MGFISTILFAGGSICSVRISILISLLPIVFGGLGAKHLYDCPKQPIVPVYLLVGGVACLSLQIFPIIYCSQSDGKIILPCRILNFLLLVFCPLWFITGSIFVYMAYEPNYESRSSAEFCERILYQVAFWITNIIYISIPLMLLCHGFRMYFVNRTKKEFCLSTVS